MKSVLLLYSVSRKLLFRGSNHLFHFIRKNDFLTKNKVVFKPVTESKEKELLHQELLTSLQKCSTVEEQIKVFYSLVKLPDENINQRYAICRDLEKELRPYFPSCSVHLIGSSVNDLGFKGCDVDLSIQLSNVNAHKKSSTKDANSTESKNFVHEMMLPKNQLLTIRKILQDSKFADPLTVIPGKCPILNFITRSLPCDLSVNNSSAFNSTNLMLLCGKLDERFIPLMQIVIYWAKRSRLVGGLAKFKTYSIFLMVVYFLQTRTPPVLPHIGTIFKETEFLKNLENWSYDVKLYLHKFEKSKNTQTVEQLLKDFFLFYGNFDFSYVICPINGTSMDRKSFVSHFNCINKFELNTICIQDPFALEWNVSTGINFKSCKNFLKAIISIWEKYQDGNIWIPESHHWGLASVIDSEFSYDNLKDIKEFSIDLPFLATPVKETCSQRDDLQKAANNLEYILSHCLLFQCQIFKQDTNINLLEFPPKVKSSIENLFFKNEDDDIVFKKNVSTISSNKHGPDAINIAKYICTTSDTWFGRNTYITNVDPSENVFDIERKVSVKMLAERGICEKDLFYFLCECLCVLIDNKPHLHVRLKPLNRDRFIPKLKVFLKDYIPYLMDKFDHVPQDKR